MTLSKAMRDMDEADRKAGGSGWRDEHGAVEAICKSARLDRRRIRETFERRFGARRMAEDYTRVYEQLAGSPMVAA